MHKDHGEQRRIDTPETTLTLDSRPVLSSDKGDERGFGIKLKFLQQEVAFTYNENVRRIFEASCVESSWPVTKNQPALFCRARGCDALSLRYPPWSVDKNRTTSLFSTMHSSLPLRVPRVSAKMNRMDGNAKSVRKCTEIEKDHQPRRVGLAPRGDSRRFEEKTHPSSQSMSLMSTSMPGRLGNRDTGGNKARKGAEQSW